ncbi:ATP-grasp domain-containing protein [Candidatus Omnitrophota bacterium]
MKIGITYNLKEHVIPQGELDSEQVEEFDSPQTIEAICSVLNKEGFSTSALGGGINIIEKLKAEKPDFVFNIAEGYCGRSREGHIPSILEMFNIPYSGSDPLTMSLTLDKLIAKKITSQAGILTPRYVTVKKKEDISGIEGCLTYPLITKPAWEGSSKGIYRDSKAEDRSAIERNVNLLLEKYPEEPVLVEEFIRGKEVTVAVIGNSPARVLGMMGISGKSKANGNFIYSIEAKRNWREEVEYSVPPDIIPSLKARLEECALSAFREFGCRDFARLDFRISEDGNIYLLELNPLPGLSPVYSDIVLMSYRLGLKYEQLIFSILDSAFSRYAIVREPVKLNAV